MHLILALTLTLQATPTVAGTQANSCFTYLVDYAANRESERAGYNIRWFRYKNGENTNPTGLNLNEPCLAYKCTTLTKHIQEDASRYETAVLNLKKGDWVELDGKTFHIKRFLGAGNSTHVFETEFNGKPAALRLPFLSQSRHDEIASQRGRLTRIERIFFESQAFYKSLLTKKGAVEVYYTDNLHKFFVVELVERKDRGDHFLSWIKSNNDELDLNLMKPSDKEKYLLLRQLMIENDDAVVTKNKTTLDLEKARQYLWDGIEWRVVDAE